MSNKAKLRADLARVTAERDALARCADKFADGIDWIQRALQAEAERDELRAFRTAIEKTDAAMQERDDG